MVKFSITKSRKVGRNIDTKTIKSGAGPIFGQSLAASSIFFFSNILWAHSGLHSTEAAEGPAHYIFSAHHGMGAVLAMVLVFGVYYSLSKRSSQS